MPWRDCIAGDLRGSEFKTPGIVGFPSHRYQRKGEVSFHMAPE